MKNLQVKMTLIYGLLLFTIGSLSAQCNLQIWSPNNNCQDLRVEYVKDNVLVTEPIIDTTTLTGLEGSQQISFQGNNCNDSTKLYVYNEAINDLDSFTFNFPTFYHEIVVSCNALPLELLSFDGIIVEDDILLLWTVLDEYYTDLYLVQYSSDGIFWKDIDKIVAIGLNNWEVNYSTTVDKRTGFYRLLEITYTGKANVISDIMYLEIEESFDTVVYPNPLILRTESTVKVTGDPKEILLFNNQGRIINVSSKKGYLDIYEYLYPGVYYLKITTKNNKILFKELIVN